MARPAIEFIAPYQTVCNHFIYFIHSLGELQSPVQAGPTGGGTVLNQNIKFVNFEQPNNIGSISTSRPWDVPPGEDPKTATQRRAARSAASTARRTARRSTPRATPTARSARWATSAGRSRPAAATRRATLSDGTPTGGNFSVTDNNLPGLRGGTYKSRELGIDNLADVP